MKSTTPPKHKTQNYKQVAHTTRDWNPVWNGWITTTTWSWQPVPLRANRKDLL